MTDNMSSALSLFWATLLQKSLLFTILHSRIYIYTYTYVSRFWLALKQTSTCRKRAVLYCMNTVGLFRAAAVLLQNFPQSYFIQLNSLEQTGIKYILNVNNEINISFHIHILLLCGSTSQFIKYQIVTYLHFSLGYIARIMYNY